MILFQYIPTNKFKTKPRKKKYVLLNWCLFLNDPDYEETISWQDKIVHMWQIWKRGVEDCLRMLKYVIFLYIIILVYYYKKESRCAACYCCLEWIRTNCSWERYIGKISFWILLVCLAIVGRKLFNKFC